MTRDDIIRLAREAGMRANCGYQEKGEHFPAINALKSDVPVEWLERFADLVAAAKREAIARHYEAQPHVEFFGSELADEIRAMSTAWNAP